MKTTILLLISLFFICGCQKQKRMCYYPSVSAQDKLGNGWCEGSCVWHDSTGNDSEYLYYTYRCDGHKPGELAPVQLSGDREPLN